MSIPKARRDKAVVQVYVRDLDQLFNSMDPSPFHQKGLDPEAEEYIVSAAQEAGQDRLVLVVHLEQPVAMIDEQEALGMAIRTHFARRAEGMARRLKQVLHEGRICLMIGLCFLSAAHLASESIIRLMQPGPWTTVLRESLVIGGWVAMWKPLETFLYDWWPILGERRIYNRLSRIPVRVVHPTTSRPILLDNLP